MSVMTLFRKKGQSEALVQAPSADLIKSDNEFSPPEPEEILFELESEKLDNYASVSDSCGFAKKVIAREKLSHLLKSLGFKVYDRLKVDSFMERYIGFAFKNLNLGNDLWWQWIDLRKYAHPLPCRVADNIKDISASTKDAIFFVSDIVLVTSRRYISDKNTGSIIHEWEVIPMKRKTEICFLRVAPSADTLPEESITIDAWRGPTFNDEEAKI